MIITKELDIKISSSNFKWFKDRGYKVKSGIFLKVQLEDLNLGSSYRIDVECDVCSNIMNVQFNNYNNQIKNGNLYVCKSCCFAKAKKTNLERYGVECPLQSEINIKKSKDTLIKRYGVDNISKLSEIKNQRSLSMKENTKYYNDIIIEKYGTNVSNLECVKEKKKKTLMENWGVENPSQNSTIFELAQKNGKRIKLHKCGLYYRGSYERDFLDYCLINKIEISKGITINFRLNNKFKVYHSDFLIKNKNLIIEIKSSYYYNKFKEINLIKKEETIKNGYNYIMIIDKDYSLFKTIF